MFNFKKYRIGFDVRGLVLSIIIMIPNFIWFAIPTENDVLRAASLTPVIDMVATIFQVIMIASLCVIKNIEYQKSENKKRLFEIIISVVVYYFGLSSPEIALQ